MFRNFLSLTVILFDLCQCQEFFFFVPRIVLDSLLWREELYRVLLSHYLAYILRLQVLLADVSRLIVE